MIATLHDIAVLRPPADAFRIDRTPGLLQREHPPGEAERIIQSYALQGRKIPLPRIERRFRHRLRYFELWKGDTLAASTWVAHGTPRYIDEIAIGFPLTPQEFWVRDIFVAPELRGMKLFAQLLAAIVAELGPDCAALWSDVDWSNRASMRAHTAAGFQITARLRALDLGRRIRLRSRTPVWHLPITDLVPARRILVWNDALRQQHRTLIA